MNTHSPSFEDILLQVKGLAEKLRSVTDDGERRALLRQFRVLLEQADAMTRTEDFLES